MVLIILCFGVIIVVLFATNVRFHISSSIWVTAYSAYYMLPQYKYLIVDLVFFLPLFLGLEFLSDCAIS